MLLWLMNLSFAGSGTSAPVAVTRFRFRVEKYPNGVVHKRDGE